MEIVKTKDSYIEWLMRYFKLIFIGLMLTSCSDIETSKSDQNLQQLAAKYDITWNEQSNHPKSIAGDDGVLLKPCDATNEQHQDLFIDLYTRPDSIKGYLDGKPKSTPEALHILIHQSYRWEDGVLLSGFVGYTPEKVPFMHCGIGTFPSKHMAEVFMIELPEYRNKGYAYKAMKALDRWASFLRKAGAWTIGEENKPEIRTLIARVSPDNIPAIKLLLKAGFQSYFNQEEFNSEAKETRPDYVKFSQQNLMVDGKSYPVTLMTTPKRSEPKVIFLKRIN